MNALSFTAILLALAGLFFPFSVAATNVVLAMVLALGVLSGLWWQGAKACWQQYRALSLVICVYMLMQFLGLLWSSDMQWGMHVLGRSWFWWLIPVVVAVTSEARWQRLFLFALSAGLALNLVYCVLQMYGYVVVDTDGSSAADATGHIGHIGFGLVYGIWAAWLLHLGSMQHGWPRFWAWGLAVWSYVMIFAAQGRSGYLIAVVLMLCIAVKWWLDTKSWKVAWLLLGGLLLVLLVMVAGPGKERMQGTWFALTQTLPQHKLDVFDSSDNAVLATNERFDMWRISLDIWQQHPLFGVGTGGLPQAVAAWKKSEGSSVRSFVHPHNQYLLNLIRWGPVGVLMLLALWLVWIREGLVVDWRCSVTAPLFTLSGLALAVHGLSSSGLEEHFSGVLAVLLLGVALSGSCEKVEC